MKVGFGGKAGQKKKSKKKGGKAKKSKGGDAAMKDVATEQHVEAAQAVQPTAKDKQRNRMALKQQLKVKVAGLKSHRQKLTKLAANKDARRSLNKEMRSLVKEQLGISNKGRSSEASKAGGSGEQPAAGGGGGGDTMAE
ncbi:hypothetical protein MNEG_5217 [Monoraphidium neglectum]|uniref:Uncharacterized protein n=1 Tax=Monoraphidium neglectum TaxID=145388 RepID=A0A0D2MI88_9CHLO|nr:hypothetical protein MNEG_5217 [Monoraphidium neglectum]KIZ02740.1 hypothetical protein MNEG_5217 [Monoraphidium neglectum]|eukprot:XP_013901759.1 hypothetical protein MNEG_5217 [Monoraphidium neglectum]